MSSPAPFTFVAFIHELVELATRARSFRTEDKDCRSLEFRRWRHNLLDLLVRVTQLGYTVNCGAHGRLFMAMQTNASPQNNLIAFENDLNETLLELDLVIERHRRYGDPVAHEHLVTSPNSRDFGGVQTNKVEVHIQNSQPAQTVPSGGEQLSTKTGEQPKWPEKNVNLKWLLLNIPIQIWITVVGALITVFAAGMWVVGTPAGKTLTGLVFAPAPAANSASSSAVLSPETVKPDAGLVRPMAEKASVAVKRKESATGSISSDEIAGSKRYGGSVSVYDYVPGPAARGGTPSQSAAILPILPRAREAGGSSTGTTDYYYLAAPTSRPDTARSAASSPPEVAEGALK